MFNAYKPSEEAKRGEPERNFAREEAEAVLAAENRTRGVSWEDQAANGGLSKWDGVKNKQAQKNLKSIRLDDLCFFYHSGAKARCVVGVISIVREWYPDGKEGIAVDVKAVGEMRAPVNLKEMKGDGGLKDFALLR
ncbi:hypothetical protein NMG60_11030965 [Bertholletia excelsa]